MFIDNDSAPDIVVVTRGRCGCNVLAIVFHSLTDGESNAAAERSMRRVDLIPDAGSPRRFEPNFRPSVSVDPRNRTVKSRRVTLGSVDA